MRYQGWAVLALAALTACGGGKDQIADRVEQNADNKAEKIEASSEATGNALQRDINQEQANQVRAAGQERADAIRTSELEENQLTAEQKNQLIEGELGTGKEVTR